MEFAGQAPPTSIVILFVTFFPLQGFFNLTVYMFPRIVRYFEEGVPLTQSFERRRSSFFSSIVTNARNSMSKRRSSQAPFAADGNADNAEEGFAHEADENMDNMVEEGTTTGENGKLDGEKDSVDELAGIVEA